MRTERHGRRNRRDEQRRHRGGETDATPRRGLCVMKALSVPGCRGEPISEFAEGDQIILLRLPRKPLLRGETGVLEPAASSSDLRGENI